MPAETIIEGLKQGNAIKLELVEKLKEGFDLVADGLKRECYNRSDALSELRDTLPKDIPNSNCSVTAEQKDYLVRKAMKGIRESWKMRNDSCAIASLTMIVSIYYHGVELERFNETLNQLKARKHSLEKMGKLLHKMDKEPKSEALENTSMKIREDYDWNRKTLAQDFKAIKEWRLLIKEKNEWREKYIEDAEAKALKTSQALKSIFHSMALILGLGDDQEFMKFMAEDE